MSDEKAVSAACTADVAVERTSNCEDTVDAGAESEDCCKAAAEEQATGGGEEEEQEEQEEEGEEKMCRYCFDEGSEENPLISPCACKGGQKWVHLSCLRRWQRMTMVSQPTHPAYWSDDKRHHECNVCKSEYTCPPPTRNELMESFTGAEIAALITEGCAIASADVFSRALEAQLASNPLLRLLSGNSHWVRGFFLITEVAEDDGTVDAEFDKSEESDFEELRLRLLNSEE